MDKEFLNAKLAAWIPITQATITGAVLGLAALVLAYASHLAKPWTWAGVVFVLGLVGTWLQTQRRWNTITGLERITHTDINQDGFIGRPPAAQPAPEVFVRLAQEVNGVLEESRGTLPATQAQMETLAVGLLGGMNFTERNFAGSGRPFSSSNYRELRDELVKRGMLIAVSDKDPRAGFVLTRGGRACMQAFCRDEPTPPLRRL